MRKIYTSADQLIGKTPLLELVHIEKSEGLEARVLGKLEYFNPAGSVKDRTIRIPVHMVETINRMRQATNQLVYQNGHEPTPEELAKAMDMSVERVREIQRMAQEPASLESPVGEEEDSSLGDFVADENAEAPGKAADRAMVAQQINLALKSLTPREEKVIRLRFGLDDGRPRTLEEVGRDFGVTRERVRQIEAKAIRKLHSRKCLTLLNGLIE